MTHQQTIVPCKVGRNNLVCRAAVHPRPITWFHQWDNFFIKNAPLNPHYQTLLFDKLNDFLKISGLPLTDECIARLYKCNVGL
jgi:hypothetical protein